MLRHGCGFKLANDGVDTRSLQAYLGASQHSEYGAVHRVGAGSVQRLLAGLVKLVTLAAMRAASARAFLAEH